MLLFGLCDQMAITEYYLQVIMQCFRFGYCYHVGLTLLKNICIIKRPLCTLHKNEIVVHTWAQGGKERRNLTPLPPNI
jgi:hypothetical protein